MVIDCTMLQELKEGKRYQSLVEDSVYHLLFSHLFPFIHTRHRITGKNMTDKIKFSDLDFSGLRYVLSSM